jgi:hypothetical protein
MGSYASIINDCVGHVLPTNEVSPPDIDVTTNDNVSTTDLLGSLSSDDITSVVHMDVQQSIDTDTEELVLIDSSGDSSGDPSRGYAPTNTGGGTTTDL